MENYQKSALFIANYSLAICCCSLNDYSNYSSSFFCNQINAFEIWYWKVSRWKKSKNKILKYFNAAQILLYPTNLRLTKCEIFSSISSINTRSMCSCSAKPEHVRGLSSFLMRLKAEKESRSHYLMFQIAIRVSHHHSAVVSLCVLYGNDSLLYGCGHTKTTILAWKINWMKRSRRRRLRIIFKNEAYNWRGLR